MTRRGLGGYIRADRRAETQGAATEDTLFGMVEEGSKPLRTCSSASTNVVVR